MNERSDSSIAGSVSPDPGRHSNETAPAAPGRFIGGKTVGLLYMPPDYVSPRKGWRGIWRRHVIANAAVRNREYMEKLFESRFPSCDLYVLDDGRIPESVLQNADNIVLLYPDAIGIDWRAIESRIIAHRPAKRVLALNGRRRLFRLDAAMRRRLIGLRFLETSRIPEVFILCVFLVATPILVLFDLVRGHR